MISVGEDYTFTHLLDLSVCVYFVKQPQADAKGYNHLFLAASGASNIGFEFTGLIAFRNV